MLISKLRRASTIKAMVEDETPTPKASSKRSHSHNVVIVDVAGDATTGTQPKPFFIMDWLEEFSPEDLKLAWKIANGDRMAAVKSSDTQPTCKGTQQQEQTATKVHSPFKSRSIAIGNGWNAKGLVKAKKGNWNAAIKCWQNALEIRSQILGETHLDVANTHNNIGIALGRLYRYPEALEHLQCALDIRIDSYDGDQHPEIATTLHNIGNVLHQAGDFEGAIRYFRVARRIQEEVLGADNVHVARACNAIGHVYYEVGQYEDALEAFCDALNVFDRAGCSHVVNEEVRGTRKDVDDITRILSTASTL